MGTNSGRRQNQSQNNHSKIVSGKEGEKIVFQYEQKKLLSWNQKELSKKVDWVTKTEDENITLDGLGYDIISFNEKKEKIYIEVKTALTNKTDDILFDITDKEVQFMNGLVEGIDTYHCFIYYVYKVNKKTLTADIKIIDHKQFSSYILKPTVYRVEEEYR